MKASISNYHFDFVNWSNALDRLIPEGENAVYAALLDVSESTIYHWRNNMPHRDTPYPNMTNLLNVCNMLDMAPGDFFTIQDNRSVQPTCQHADYIEADFNVSRDSEPHTIKTLKIRSCRDCGHTISYTLSTVTPFWRK